ncbi:hypothetical protein [Modestobacter sp. Leaf380]|uniref:DUF6916 family protein n=1 Tax=Modestobacter sp. Leaf380 TaxID=1736356 RepID=UPI0006FA058C|nr:hypothetical protein [Modestobacter sp. Leaf380]KQS69078.1 hypothetical protein ASG41_22325 [Modestobacter sp. Leaf380]
MVLVSRRHVLAGAGALGLAGALGPLVAPAALAVDASAVRGPLPVPGRSAYLGVVGAVFTAVTGDAVAHELRLRAVLDPTTVPADPESAFTLALEDLGAGTRPLQEGIVELATPGVGTAVLFLSPVGAVGERELHAVVRRGA